MDGTVRVVDTQAAVALAITTIPVAAGIAIFAMQPASVSLWLRAPETRT